MAVGPTQWFVKNEATRSNSLECLLRTRGRTRTLAGVADLSEERCVRSGLKRTATRAGFDKDCHTRIQKG